MIKNFIRKAFSNFYWFYSYLRYRIFIGVVLSILVGLLDGFGLTMFLPLLQMVAGDSNVTSDGMGNLNFLIRFIHTSGLSLTLGVVLFFMLLFFILKGVTKYFSLIYRVSLQQSLLRKIRLNMLNSLNNVSFKYFVTTDVGRIQNTLTGEVDRIQQAYTMYFQSTEQIILVMVYMCFAFFVDFQFAILVTLGGALTNILYKSVYKHTKGASVKLTGDSNFYQGKIIQHVTNFKYLRATGSIEKFSNQLELVIHKIESSIKRIGVLSGFLESAREPLLIGVVALVIFIQVNILQGSLGPILISLLFFYRALSALTQMQNAWNRFLSVSGSLDNLKVFQQELFLNREDSGTKKIASLNNGISVVDVSFSFDDFSILKGINLNIPKNMSVAFVGESGSGKTTLINLICGLYPVDEGEILIDGIPLRLICKSSFQKRIGYITQEPVIFNDSIFNNVTLWADKNPESERRCKEALKKASALNFVEDQKQGLETLLGNNGINLSGGQKQRIAIARELFKEIDILIMDEATSALDSETEKVIQENIDSLKGKYTILIVAHRLSTIKNADLIVLMDKGTIKEKDSFDSLVKRVPRFKKMVELQEV